MKAAQDAGERLSVAVTAASVRDTAGIEPAIAAGSDDRGLLVPPQGGFISSIRATMIALAAKYLVPAIFYDRRFPAAA